LAIRTRDRHAAFATELRDQMEQRNPAVEELVQGQLTPVRARLDELEHNHRVLTSEQHACAQRLTKELSDLRDEPTASTELFKEPLAVSERCFQAFTPTKNAAQMTPQVQQQPEGAGCNATIGHTSENMTAGAYPSSIGKAASVSTIPAQKSTATTGVQARRPSMASPKIKRPPPPFELGSPIPAQQGMWMVRGSRPLGSIGLHAAPTAGAGGTTFGTASEPVDVDSPASPTSGDATFDAVSPQAKEPEASMPSPAG